MESKVLSIIRQGVVETVVGWYTRGGLRVSKNAATLRVNS